MVTWDETWTFTVKVETEEKVGEKKPAEGLGLLLLAGIALLALSEKEER